jgi:hypothetical protein
MSDLEHPQAELLSEAIQNSICNLPKVCRNLVPGTTEQYYGSICELLRFVAASVDPSRVDCKET